MGSACPLLAGDRGVIVSKFLETTEDSFGPGGNAEDEGASPQRRRGLKAIALLLAGALVLAGAVIVGGYLSLQGNIASVDVASRLGSQRPAPPEPGQGDALNEPESEPEAAASKDGTLAGPLTIAVFGDDTRRGRNSFIGGPAGAGRSDTTMIVRLNAARTRAQVISIPRDSMVQRPDCVGADGQRIPGELTMFNAAYAVGGPACAIKTIEAVTGVRIDQYVVVDFEGFRSVVDAVGGVDVDVPVAIKDPKSGLAIPAGENHFDGDEALAFVRNRYGFGDGSDLGRIGMQQLFTRALAEKVKSMDLTDLPTLYAFLDAATSSLTTSPDLAKLRNLAELARDLRGIPNSAIEFATVPTRAYAPDPNRVEFTPVAKTWWAAIRKDQPLPS